MSADDVKATPIVVHNGGYYSNESRTIGTKYTAPDGSSAEIYGPNVIGGVALNDATTSLHAMVDRTYSGRLGREFNAITVNGNERLMLKSYDSVYTALHNQCGLIASRETLTTSGIETTGGADLPTSCEIQVATRNQLFNNFFANGKHADLLAKLQQVVNPALHDELFVITHSNYPQAKTVEAVLRSK